jgi:hypothetical protein
LGINQAKRRTQRKRRENLNIEERVKNERIRKIALFTMRLQSYIYTKTVTKLT